MNHLGDQLSELILEIEKYMEKGYKPQTIQKNSYTMTQTLIMERRKIWPSERRRQYIPFLPNKKPAVVAYLYGAGFLVSETPKPENKENQ